MNDAAACENGLNSGLVDFEAGFKVSANAVQKYFFAPVAQHLHAKGHAIAVFIQRQSQARNARQIGENRINIGQIHTHRILVELSQ